jgi:hypothetical protein
LRINRYSVSREQWCSGAVVHTQALTVRRCAGPPQNDEAHQLPCLPGIHRYSVSREQWCNGAVVQTQAPTVRWCAGPPQNDEAHQLPCLPGNAQLEFLQAMIALTTFVSPMPFKAVKRLSPFRSHNNSILFNITVMESS